MRNRPALALLILASGCASPDRDDYPSLMPRPIESRGDAITTPPETPAPPADAALTATIARLRTALSDGTRRFDAALVEGERPIRAGARAAPGTDAWVEAQAALSALTAAQASTTAVLTEIDDLLAGRVTGGDRSGTTEIVALRTEAEAAVAAQRNRVAPLAALLPA